MRKITKKVPVDLKKKVYTEGINYFASGDASIWGNGDADTLRELTPHEFHDGTWINLAAGDGRYNELLLTKVDALVATDIDEGALSKLWHKTPKNLQKKLQVKKLDLNSEFPFRSESIGGVFSTGVLHLFSVEDLQKIIDEIYRVLVDGGEFIFDFAADRVKVDKDGNKVLHQSQINYTLAEAKKVLPTILKDFTFTWKEFTLPPEEVDTGSIKYFFSCNYLLVFCKKKSKK